MQTSEMRACSYISECSLSYTKTMQTSEMRACSYISECSLSYTKTMQGERNGKARKRSFIRLDTAEPKLVLYKDK